MCLKLRNPQKTIGSLSSSWIHFAIPPKFHNIGRLARCSLGDPKMELPWRGLSQHANQKLPSVAISNCWQLLFPAAGFGFVASHRMDCRWWLAAWIKDPMKKSYGRRRREDHRLCHGRKCAKGLQGIPKRWNRGSFPWWLRSLWGFSGFNGFVLGLLWAVVDESVLECWQPGTRPRVMPKATGTWATDQPAQRWRQMLKKEMSYEFTKEWMSANLKNHMRTKPVGLCDFGVALGVQLDEAPRLGYGFWTSMMSPAFWLGAKGSQICQQWELWWSPNPSDPYRRSKDFKVDAAHGCAPQALPEARVGYCLHMFAW